MIRNNCVSRECVYDKDHMNALTSESDSRSYVVLQIKPRKNSEAPTGSRWSLRIFVGSICTCLSYYLTARLSFTCNCISVQLFTCIFTVRFYYNTKLTLSCKHFTEVVNTWTEVVLLVSLSSWQISWQLQRSTQESRGTGHCVGCKHRNISWIVRTKIILVSTKTFQLLSSVTLPNNS